MVTNNKPLSFQETLHLLPEDKFEFSDIDIEITQCSYCRRYLWADGVWSIVSPAIPCENIAGNITNGICPECWEKVIAEI